MNVLVEIYYVIVILKLQPITIITQGGEESEVMTTPFGMLYFWASVLFYLSKMDVDTFYGSYWQ